MDDGPDPYHLSRILHELAGSVSVCWDRDGVFQTTQAAEFVAAAIAEIRQRMKDAPPQRKPLTEEDAAALIELDPRMLKEFGTAPSGAAMALIRRTERAHGIGG